MGSSTSLRLYCHCKTAHHLADINPQNGVLNPPHHIISSFEFPHLFQHFNDRSFLHLSSSLFICTCETVSARKKVRQKMCQHIDMSAKK